MQIGKAGGFQVAFFIFAVFLLAAPLSKYLGRIWQIDGDPFEMLARIVQLSLLASMILLAEWVKPNFIGSMLQAIPADRRLETAIFTAAKAFVPFAVIGAVALWLWYSEGTLAVERRFPTDDYHTIGEAKAYSAAGLLFLFAAVAMAPLIEEIAFRGLLYSAFERSLGWFPATFASAAVFGLFHGWFVSAFIAGVLFACLYRRTGTLIAPIVAHAVGNAVAWYPLLGQHYWPRPNPAFGDLPTWWFHLVCLTAFVWLIPLYIFMARRAYPREAT
jgi:membrane protease YdiL (CAAX protease family)